ncbi:MAG: LytTR family DNA-binding domain-containing protein [Roseburia sp.]|nr:LytTR family DNA-binding domain-containing protein [Roseburia sp.]
MRILICDDDDTILEQLQSFIQDFFHNNHLSCPQIAAFHDGESLLADKNEKNLVFLDIEMRERNGIYVADALKKKNPNTLIIIVTSYIEYLDDAMRCEVFRYLIKPIEKERLFRNLKDALKVLNSITVKIPVETKEGLYTIQTSELISVESIDHKAVLHTALRDYVSIHPLKYWKDTLPSHCFYQTHKSFLVNLEHVTGFDHSLVHLSDPRFSAYLTRRKYTQFKEAYLLYLESSM